MKKTLFWCIVVVCLYGLLESVAFVALIRIDYGRFTHVPGRHVRIINSMLLAENRYLAYSRTLGWTVKPDGRSDLYRSNSAGIRSEREYLLDPPPGILRISAFGDSYTHGDEVANEDTWETAMENDQPCLEMLNFGVGGYGLDQAYLRFLEQGRRFNSHVVLIGFMSENIYRNMYTYRPFRGSRTRLPLAKPRFDLEGDSLIHISNPLSRMSDYAQLIDGPADMLPLLGRSDYYYQRRYEPGSLDRSFIVRLTNEFRHRRRRRLAEDRIVVDGRYNVKGVSFAILTRLMDTFYEEVRDAGATPIILLLPERKDLERLRDGDEKLYVPLLAYLDSRSYRYLDTVAAFEGYDLDDVVRSHYTPLGNRLVAGLILRYLKESGIHTGCDTSRKEVRPSGQNDSGY